ncbi:hypothetical protein [Edaphobacter aggregans]|uniref:hypothetical protein n=1 Tax=Edaphobacter aggregans TaxID=570835 RepID=UPI0006901DEF|nr:hypothetical protein [Edaphobacter aggregans]
MIASAKGPDFSGYPPQARQLAAEHLTLLQSLPISFAALLAQEISSYDWKFPVEQADLQAQLKWLQPPRQERLQQILDSFARLMLSPELQRYPWLSQPKPFVEKLTAYLWTSGSIDAFRTAATKYGQFVEDLRTVSVSPSEKRLCIVVVGRDAQSEKVKLFSKLRPYGTYFTNIDPTNGLEHCFAVAHSRAMANRVPYGHWYVDGGAAEREDPAEGVMTTLSYASLTPLREALLDKMHTARVSGASGPEELRSILALLEPSHLAQSARGQNTLLQHFQMSLLTEGSGTQLFSTTFVQWSAREILRRAQPQTLLLRYQPRQVERPMDDLVRAGGAMQNLDPAGSLIDADMGAYYTWLNLTRLPGAESSRFVAWFENQRAAMVIAPGMARNTVSAQQCTLDQVFRWILS